MEFVSIEKIAKTIERDIQDVIAVAGPGSYPVESAAGVLVIPKGTDGKDADSLASHMTGQKPDIEPDYRRDENGAFVKL